MWYLVCVIVGVIGGAVGMYVVAPKLKAIQQKAVARLRQLGQSG